jgi:hypothetical protein
LDAEAEEPARADAATYGAAVAADEFAFAEHSPVDDQGFVMSEEEARR